MLQLWLLPRLTLYTDGCLFFIYPLTHSFLGESEDSSDAESGDEEDKESDDEDDDEEEEEKDDEDDLDDEQEEDDHMDDDRSVTSTQVERKRLVSIFTKNLLIW